MRLGGPAFGDISTPAKWVAALKRFGYTAAVWPTNAAQDEAAIETYLAAAHEADIVIAEVGAWSNPLSHDEPTRRAALEKCRAMLALAERVDARCCVNIAGSRGGVWDGPHPANLTRETFGLIVETVRDIIDAVKPTRTFYTLEPMPWIFPDSADSYVDLLRAVDRPRFAVHFDPVNIVCSPRRYFENGALIRDFVAKLGPHIKSCHAKDILLSDTLTVHLDEARPGAGSLDYRAFLRALDGLDPDLPVLLEHMKIEEDYRLGVDYIRAQARDAGVALR